MLSTECQQSWGGLINMTLLFLVSEMITNAFTQNDKAKYNVPTIINL